jgi:outer membrane protein
MKSIYMKKANKVYFIMKSTFLFCICSFLLSSCNDTFRLCYVNPNKLLQDYHGAAAQHELFQVKAQGWQQRVDSLSTELQIISQGQAPTPTRASKEQQLLRYREAIQQQAQQENQRLTKAVLEEINAYLKQYGKDHGYTFILGATESGNIVYAADGTDITEEVLKSLNAQYDRQHAASAQ